MTDKNTLDLARQGDAMLKLHAGDCIDVLKTLPDDSVDSVVTSPPYAMQRASTYGGIPERDYPAWTVAWMQEVWRVLKDDGSVIINISPHIKNGEISDYVLRTRLALRDVGWAELPELIWHKTAAMPTGAPNRPRRTWESLLWFAKHGRAFGNPKANGHPLKSDRWRPFDRGQAADNGWAHGWVGSSKRPDVARCTDIYSSNVNQAKTGHPASFPVGLAEWCGKLITPPGGTILDPFTGSSSTGVAAIRNGWNFIGIDQSAEYIEMSRKRLDAELAKETEGGEQLNLPITLMASPRDDCEDGMLDGLEALLPAPPAPESAAPHPEGVPVGEPWQVEVDGQAAIGYRDDPEASRCWTVVHRDGDGPDWIYDADVTLIARLVPETTEQDPPAKYGPYTRINEEHDDGED